MSNYKKFTLKDVATKLKNGEYAGLTGANRSIGKAQELSEADKTKARAMAAKHFGAEPAAAPKKKKGKKAAKAKTSAKKVAKAGRAKKTKKSAKKAGRAAAKAEAAAPQSVAQPVQKEAPVKRASRVPRTPSNAGKVQSAAKTAEPSHVSSRVNSVAATLGSVIGTVDQALKSMQFAKQLCPKEDMAAGVTAAMNTMSRAVRALDNEVVTPLLPASDPIDPPAQRTPSNKGTAQKAALAKSKKAKKTKAAPATKNGTAHLTPEELEELKHLQETQPAALAAAGLRKVPPELTGEANGTSE